MAYLTAQDGTDIFYYDWGKGVPIILIHGWPLTSASWEHQAATFAASGFRVIAYDRRGFGRSGWPYIGYDYDTLAGDLNTLINTLKLEQAYLVGFSMGGGEVARYLAKYGSAKIKKAVFLAAVTPYLLKTNDNPRGVDKKFFDDIVDKIQEDRAAFLKDFSQKFYNYSMINHTVSSSMLEFFQMMAMTASPDATVKLVRAWSETDFREDLKQITIPTLSIHGTDDAAVPFESSAELAANILPNNILIKYEGQSHGLITTAYDRVNQDVMNFILG